MLVVLCTKMGTKDSSDSPVIVGDTLERKSRITFFPFRSVVVAGWTVAPFNMNNVDRSDCARQSYLFVSGYRLFNLFFISRMKYILTRNTFESIDKC